jgi:hypothetical protein
MLFVMFAVSAIAGGCVEFIYEAEQSEKSRRGLPAKWNGYPKSRAI